MRNSRIFLELNDTAFKHLEKAEVVLTYKEGVKLEDGTRVEVIPISKRNMKYKAQHYLDWETNKKPSTGV